MIKVHQRISKIIIKKDEVIKKRRKDEDKSSAKALPYVNGDHVSNVYNIIIAPYSKNGIQKKK